MFDPRNLTPKARSNLPKTCCDGIAFPLSYSLTTVGFSQIFYNK